MRYLQKFYRSWTTVSIFSAQSQIINTHYGISVGIRWYTLLVTVLVVPLGIGRTLKFLVPVSAFGIVFIIFGLMTTGYYAIQDLPAISERNFVARIDQMPLFFSTIVFAMEGIGTVRINSGTFEVLDTIYRNNDLIFWGRYYR